MKRSLTRLRSLRLWVIFDAWYLNVDRWMDESHSWIFTEVDSVTLWLNLWTILNCKFVVVTSTIDEKFCIECLTFLCSQQTMPLCSRPFWSLVWLVKFGSYNGQQIK
jgi:hypothetical protein